MKKFRASLKKYPHDWMILGAALACGAGWVSGSALLAIIGLVGFILLLKLVNAGGNQ